MTELVWLVLGLALGACLVSLLRGFKTEPTELDMLLIATRVLADSHAGAGNMFNLRQAAAICLLAAFKKDKERRKLFLTTLSDSIKTADELTYGGVDGVE